MKKVHLNELSQSLQKKFQLTDESSSEPPLMLNQVISPVIDVQKLLVKSTAKTSTKTISGTGLVVCHTVPSGEKWTISHIWAYKSSGTFTMDEIHIARQYYLTTGLDFRIFSATALSSIGYFLPHPIVLLPSDQIAISISAFTLGGDLIINVLCDVEAF